MKATRFGSVIVTTATGAFRPAKIGWSDLALARINSCDYALAAVPLCEPLTGGGGRRIVTCRRVETTARWGRCFDALALRGNLLRELQLCTTSGMTAPADYDRCHLALAFHVNSGDVDGVDVSGLTVAVLADAPPLMSEGNWRVGVLMDAAASEEQAEALGAVFSGQRGGPMSGLAPLIGEMLGIEVAPVEYADDGRRHRVRIGDAIDLEVEDFVSPFDPTGAGVKVSGVGFPADTLAAGRATASRVNVFGLEWSNEGKNSFSAPFAWSA